jgi:hypothetical protein
MKIAQQICQKISMPSHCELSHPNLNDRRGGGDRAGFKRKEPGAGLSEFSDRAVGAKEPVQQRSYGNSPDVARNGACDAQAVIRQRHDGWRSGAAMFYRLRLNRCTASRASSRAIIMQALMIEP